MTQVNSKKAKTLEEKMRVKAMIDLKPKKNCAYLRHFKLPFQTDELKKTNLNR